MSFSRKGNVAAKIGGIIVIVIVSFFVLLIGWSLTINVFVPSIDYKAEVSTAEEFFDACKKVKISRREYKYVSINADIDCGGRTLFLAGASNIVIEGNGHKLYNIKVEKTEGDNIGAIYTNLGSPKSSATGNSVTFNNITIEYDINYMGNGECIGFFSSAYGNVYLKGVTFNGSVNAPAATNVGGLFGERLGYGVLQIDNVTSNVNVIGMQNVGGFIGHLDECYATQINGAVFTGNLTAIKENAGGIAGLSDNDDAYSDVPMYACVNKGKINGQSNCGGIIGQAHNISLEECVNEGEVRATKGPAGGIAGKLFCTDVGFSTNKGEVFSEASYVGGIAGIVETKNYPQYKGKNFSSNKNSGNVKGNNYVGGIFGCVNGYSMLVTKCENTGDVSGTSFVGGIIGNLKMGTGTQVTYSSNSANLICSGNYCAGIVGGLSALSYWDKLDLSKMSTNTTRGLVNGSPSTNIYNKED